MQHVGEGKIGLPDQPIAGNGQIADRRLVIQVEVVLPQGIQFICPLGNGLFQLGVVIFLHSLQPGIVDRPLHNLDHVIEPKRLLHEVEGANFKRLNRHLQLGVAGHNDNRNFRPCLANTTK